MHLNLYHAACFCPRMAALAMEPADGRRRRDCDSHYDADAGSVSRVFAKTRTQHRVSMLNSPWGGSTARMLPILLEGACTLCAYLWSFHQLF